MTISMYAASIPVFKQMLTSLNAILAKVEAHATAKKIDPNVLLQARSFPDMFPLIRQVQIAADFAKERRLVINPGATLPLRPDRLVEDHDRHVELPHHVAANHDHEIGGCAAEAGSRM